jgi:hypothetical protein
MSRRHKLPSLPEGYIRTFLIAVVCTDRGQHARARIADLSGAALPGEDPSLCWVEYVQGELVEQWMSAEAWRTYTFDCRRCRRHVQLREPRLIAAVTALDKSGVSDGRPVLDISLRGLGLWLLALRAPDGHGRSMSRRGQVTSPGGRDTCAQGGPVRGPRIGHQSQDRPRQATRRIPRSSPVAPR